MEENKAQVSTRHREEWAAFRNGYLTPLQDSGSIDDAKFAKAYADILKVYQEGERKAYGFADGEVDSETSITWDSGAE